MKEDASISLDEVLESVLRGAAKTLGCNSANLVVFNEVIQEVRIQVGLILERRFELERLERMLGNAVNFLSFDFEQTKKTALYRSWHDRVVSEVSSLQVLARGAFPEDLLELADRLIGDHRFLLVPVLGESLCYGVVLFEKTGTHPFSAQQRDLLIRYANRMGEIIENHARSFSFSRKIHPWQSAVKRLFFYGDGAIMGGSVEDVAELELPSGFLEKLAEKSSRLLGSLGRDAMDGYLGWPSSSMGSNESRPELEARLEKVFLKNEPCILCEIRRIERGKSPSIGNHLLQIALDRPAPALLLDPEFRITSCNEATGALLGFSSDELLGKEIGSLFHQDADIHTILNHQFLFLSDGHYEETTTLRRKDKTPLRARVEAVLLADEADRIVGYLMLVREQESSRTADAANGGAAHMMRKERLATMGEIAAQLAHEIRNPILAIGATLESLSAEHDLGSDYGRILSSLSGEILRLDMILKDYLSLAARQNTSITKINLREVMDDACRLLKGFGRIKGRTISGELPDTEIYGDFDGLKQVFFNLLINAMEASPPGGAVEYDCEIGDNEVAVHIEDKGPGIKGNVEECFSPFYSTKPNGTGLGLVVCRKILKAHSGSITLKNREGGGCRASVILPRRIS